MLDYDSITDHGLIRDSNEDSVDVFDVLSDSEVSGGAFIVADGMGAGTGGETASRITVERFAETVRLGIQQFRHDTDSVLLVELLEAGIKAANETVRRRQKERLELHQMATTCAAVLVLENQAAYGNVGDSRIYLLRNRRMVQISIEHVSILHKAKSRKDATHFRSSITRGIGFADYVYPDLGLLTLLPGDCLLICTDGLTNNVPEHEIARILSTDLDAKATSRALVDTAKQRGGDDNITVIVCRYGEQACLPAIATSVEESKPVALASTAMPAYKPPRRAYRVHPAALIALLICLALGSVACWQISVGTRNRSATEAMQLR